MPPIQNSSLSNIYAFSVVKRSFLRDGDFNLILSEFMKEIKEMESDEGMALNVIGLKDLKLTERSCNSVLTRKVPKKLGVSCHPVFCTSD